MKRLQENDILKDLREKYVFLAGPRQVGKTTLAKQLFPAKEIHYLNYDLSEDRQLMKQGAWNREAKLVILDEFHKFPKWKTFLKGYYDKEGLPPPILVTGSAKLNVFRKGNDSMVGRYFYHRLLPFSVKELSPQLSSREALQNLLAYGNYPEPLLKASATSSKRWRDHHLNLILREDITDLSNVRMLHKIQLLIDLLRQRVGQSVSYASLAQDLEVAPKTVKEWIGLLEQVFVIFRVTPYHQNIARSLLKEPKIYFFDCTMAFDPDAHLENLVAVSLLKHLWYQEDLEGISGSLHYLRTKDGKEIDFALVEERKITTVIEVKKTEDQPIPAFAYFAKFLPSTCRKIQAVEKLKQAKTVHGIQVKAVADFLMSLKM